MPHRVAALVAGRLGWVKVQGDKHWKAADGTLRTVADWLPSVHAPHAIEALSALIETGNWYFTIERRQLDYKVILWRSDALCWKTRSVSGVAEERKLAEAITRAVLIATTPMAR